LQHAATLGGIFVAGTRDLRLLVGAGDSASGAMLVRFSERVAINDEDSVAFGAHLSAGGVNREAVLLAGTSGLTEVAGVGDTAPGGGKFSAFGAWPTLGPADRVAFVAAIDGGPGPLGIYVRQGGNLARVAMVGERLGRNKSLPGLALNPVTTAGRNGGLTFATMALPETGENGIYYFGPAPDPE